MEVTKLLKAFEEAAIKQFDALERGNSCIANRCYKKMKKVSKQLYDMGEISALRTLLNNEHINVRLIAATKLLPFYTEEAEEVLEKIKNAKNLTGFNAEMTLQEWRKGNMKFDY